jgi:hypothetical protein
LFLNPNVAAALMVPAIPACWLLAGSTGRRRWLWVVTALLAAGVAATGSRAGLLALILVVGMMVPAGRLRLAGIGFAVAAAAGFLAWRFMTRPDSLAWHRLEIWRALGSLLLQHPILGVGPGRLEDVTGVIRIADHGSFARFGHVIGGAESTPFGLLVRTGLAGVAAAGAGVLLWWRRVRHNGQLARSEARAVLASVATMALFHDYLDVDVVLWWWAILLAASFPLIRGKTSDQLHTVGLRPVRIVAGLALALVVLWSVAQPAYGRHVWWSGPSEPARADRAIRAEMWFAEPASWMVADLLALESWTWPTAAEALSWSRQTTTLHPGGWMVWMQTAQVHGRIVTELGPWPQTVEAARTGFRTATELEPHLPWPWLEWARLERALGAAGEARRLVERAVAEEPNFVRGHLFLSRLALDAGDIEGAQAAFERAQSAFELGRQVAGTDYQRDLFRAPSWQVEDIGGELASAGGGVSADADPIQ